MCNICKTPEGEPIHEAGQMDIMAKNEQKFLDEWLEKFDGYKLIEYGKWRIGRVEVKNFLRDFYKAIREKQ